MRQAASHASGKALILVAAMAALATACGQAADDRAAMNASETEAAAPGQITVYNGADVLTIPNPLNRGIKILKDGQKTLAALAAPFLVTADARFAAENLAYTRDWYNDHFGRFSYDGQGAEIKAVVEVQRFHLVPILGMKENAAWMGQFHHFIFGAGGADLDGFAQAIDVIAHEYTHAVVGSSSKLGFAGQSGALDEHLADVFGEFVQHSRDPQSAPFFIGETVLRGKFAQEAHALRDMLHPELSLGKQPATMSDIPADMGPDCQPTQGNDACGRHLLNSIPNKAAALIIEGLGWDASEKLFYTVMTERLTPTSDFAAYRDLLADECAAEGLGTACHVVKDAFAQVGL